MKKVLFVLVVALTFIGCSKPERICYAEFKLLSNQDDAFQLQYVFGSNSNLYTDPNYSPLPNGFTLTSDEQNFEKGSNIIAAAYASGGTSFTQLDQIEIKFYVDGSLEETRTVNNNGGNVTFIVP